MRTAVPCAHSVNASEHVVVTNLCHEGGQHRDRVLGIGKVHRQHFAQVRLEVPVLGVAW